MATNEENRTEPAPATPDEDALPEGPQPRPRGVLPMAVVRWILILGAIGAAVFAVGHYFKVWETQTKSEARYRCPMHPSIISDRPGECPICGMTLVPIGEMKKHKRYAYVCPIHPEQGSEHPGKCPIGGEKLLKQPPLPKGLTTIHLPAERIQLIGVRTAIVKRKQVAHRVRTVGYVTVDESRLAHVHTRFAGWIEQLYVKETGEYVKKEEPLAGIYSNELYLAQVEYVDALRAVDRAPSPEMRTIQKSVTNAARKRLRLLGIEEQEIRALEKTRKPKRAQVIRSPVSGHVLQKMALLGMYLKPGTELFTISNLSRVWVLADIYEYDLPHVRRGQKARIRVEAHPGKTFTGRVSFLYPTVDDQTRTLKVRIVLRNPHIRLRPGMYAHVDLAQVRRKALVAPSEAIVNTGEQEYAFVALRGGVFEPRLVKTGYREGELVEIRSGLEEGDRVVTSANFLIDSESRLRAAAEGMTGGKGTAGHQH